MANYNIIIDTSKFKPYDISTALQILHDYRDAYDKSYEELLKIADEGDITLPEDSKYYDVLLEYNLEFDDVSDYFSKRGLNMKSSAKIQAIRNRNRKEIKPIKQGIDEYNKYVDNWNNIIANDPTAIRGYDYSIDDFYGGKKLDIGYRSGKQILTDAATYFAGISNALMKDPTFKEVMNGLYWLLANTPGITGELALTAALVEYLKRTAGLNNAEVQDLLNHMNKLYDGYLVENFTDLAKNQVWNRISMGLLSSVTAPTYNNVANQNFESDAARESRLVNQSHMRAQTEGLEWLNKTAELLYLLLNSLIERDDKGNIIGYKSTSGIPVDIKNIHLVSDSGEVTIANNKDSAPQTCKYTKNAKTGKFTLYDLEGQPITGYTDLTESNLRTLMNNANTSVNTAANPFLSNDDLERLQSIKNHFIPFEFKRNSAGINNDFKGTTGEWWDYASIGNVGFGDTFIGNKRENLEETNKVTDNDKVSILQKAKEFISQLSGIPLELLNNLKYKDFDLIIDNDWFNNDQVRVVPKGVNAKYYNETMHDLVNTYKAKKSQNSPVANAGGNVPKIGG